MMQRQTQQQRRLVFPFASLLALVIISIVSAAAWTTTPQRTTASSTFTRHHPAVTTARRRKRRTATNTKGSVLRMDYEDYGTERQSILDGSIRAHSSEVPARRIRRQISKDGYINNSSNNIVSAERYSHGIPWRTSIDPTYHNKEHGRELFFMPFWEKQMAFMKEHLTNLRSLPVTSHKGQDMTIAEAPDGSIRMHTLLFASEEYRRIRVMTYDAGNQTQIFTSIWYPHAHSNLPIFGVNLMQFHMQRHICAVDFQPIHDCERDHDADYEHLLRPIRNRYPSLHAGLNPRVYDGKQFFSNQTLLGRFDADDDVGRKIVFSDLLPAFESYMTKHVQLVQSTRPNDDKKASNNVLKRQRDYEVFFEKRDPTHASLTKSFGSDFADDFLFDIHFPLIKDEILQA